MNEKHMSSVDGYIVESLIPHDPILEAVLKESDSAGLPQYNVAPNQGKMLQLFAKMQKAKRILEIGTLGGYSTIWLARALAPDGKLITLEYEPKFAEVARKNISRAGLSSQVEVKVGRAVDSLAQMYNEDSTPFDFIFIDADKPSNPEYLHWSLKFSKPGTLIVVDNVVRDGKVTDSESSDLSVQGTRKLFELLSKEDKVSATAIQTVGSKGWDGFAMAFVK